MKTTEKSIPHDSDDTIECEIAPGVVVVLKRRHLNPSFEDVREALFSDGFADMIGAVAGYMGKKRKVDTSNTLAYEQATV